MQRSVSASDKLDPMTYGKPTGPNQNNPFVLDICTVG